MPYSNPNFPYSSRTPILVGHLPPWMKISSDSESIGQQFINAISLTLDEIESSLGNALNNQYIGSANIGQVDWIYKIYYSLELSQRRKYKVYDNNDSEIVVCHTLNDFYSSEVDACILDFEKRILYLNANHDSIKILDKEDNLLYEGDDIVAHHVWNCFDEMALLLGVARRPNETNAELKERILNVFRYPGNSTNMGLVFAIAGQLGLIQHDTWNAGTASHGLPINTYPESIKVDNQFANEGEYVIEENNITLNRKVRVLHNSDDEYIVNGCSIHNGMVSLSNDAIGGSVITPAITLPSLDSWGEIEFGPNTEIPEDITVDILRGSEEVYTIKYGLTNGDLVSIDGSTPLNHSVRLRVNLSRVDEYEDSPKVSSLYLLYEGLESSISYITKDNITLNAMYNDDFRKSELFLPDGTPTQEMTTHVKELSDIAPILWDRFTWDEAYWDVVEDNLMGLDVLPNIWDPNLGIIANQYKQVGIGDDKDLLTKVSEGWAVQISPGYYYTGQDLEEYYLYSRFTMETFIDAGTSLLVYAEIPPYCPIIVKSEETYLTRVFFLDTDYNYSIENSEEVTGNGTNTIYLQYSNIDMDSVSLSGGYSVDNPLAYDGTNKLVLDNIVEANETVIVTYKIKNSFMAVLGANNTLSITLSEAHPEVQVIFGELNEPPYIQVANIQFSRDSIAYQKEDE